MNFNKLVEEEPEPLFKAHGFLIAEIQNNYIRLQLRSLEIRLAHNKRENTCIMFIYGPNQIGGEFSSDVIDILFSGKIHVDFSPIDRFVKDVRSLFQSEALPLLKGDMKILMLAHEYMRDRAKIYTEKLLYEQELRQAEIAWSAKEYKKFIKVMNGIAIEKWSDIYKLKYKIALKNII